MNNNYDLVVYLAGAMGCCKTYAESHAWRNAVSKKLNEIAEQTGSRIKIIDPTQYYNFDNTRHQNEHEIKQFDLNKVHESDLVIANMFKINNSIGTVIECHMANKWNIPVIALDLESDVNNLLDGVHPWIVDCITRVEPSIIDLCDYIRDFHL